MNDKQKTEILKYIENVFFGQDLLTRESAEEEIKKVFEDEYGFEDEDIQQKWYNKIAEREVQNMPQIIPIKDLKNTAEISELCHKSAEPIYITKNGYGDMVIMSMEIYEQTMKQLNIYTELELSEKQIQEGNIKDARTSLSSMRERYRL